MYEIKTDVAKNVLFIKLAGFMLEAEAKDAADDLIAKLGELKPGMTIVNDISEFKPAGEATGAHIKRGQAAAFKVGVGRVIRVFGKSLVSNMQFNRLQKEEKAEYETVDVETMEDALKLL